MCGFPSAQIVNRPPNMLSLYTSAPCVSCVPGFPSARMLSSEHLKIRTMTTQTKSLFKNKQNEKIFLIAKFPAKDYQDEMKSMIAIAPSCPHSTKIPGIPSILQLNPTEKETMAIPLPTSTEKHTTPELPHVQSTQSHLKDTINPVVPSTSVSSQSTEHIHGETYSVVIKLKDRFIFLCHFLCHFYYVCFYNSGQFPGWSKANCRPFCR